MLLKNKLINTLFVLVVTFVGTVQAQNRFLQEKVVLTTDRTLYFSGEQILLNATCVLPVNNDSLSRVVYVELLDKKSKPILQKKLLIVKGMATTVVYIPEDVITGNYYLRAYTQYMRNLDIGTFYTNELMIVNPDLPAKEAIQSVLDSIAIGSTSSFNKGKEVVEINPSAASFLPNSLVSLDLKGKNNTNVSVSVVKKGSYEPVAVGIQRYFQMNSTPSNKLNWYPEIRSVSISGKVVDKATQQPLKNIFVYASIIDSAKQFHVARTNEEGVFIFSLTNLHENHQVYVCAEVDATILINSDFATGFPSMHYKTVKMDSSKLTLIDDMYKNAQVSKLYDEELTSSKMYLDTLPDPFRSSGETILFKDYVPLALFTDYFKEIIPYTRIKTRKEGSVIQLVDKRNKEFFDHPLVMIDNIPFHDHDALLSIAPAKIDAVSVIASKFVFGKEVLQGVVMVKTKEGNLGGLPLPADVVSVDYIAYDPLVTITTEKENKFSAAKPGLKNTLYWDAAVDLSDGHETIQFYSSNALSDYDVVVRGVDDEGNEFTQVKTITVMNK